MTRETMTQAAYWNGEVGQRWARSQATLDAVFAPLTEALFAQAALPAGAMILDVGCGAGATALMAAGAVGRGGRVLGADLSAPLLTVARGRPVPEGGAPVSFVEADAETFDFGAGTFDHAISRFGVMFFANSRTAFANIRRALKPGGGLTFLCWQAMADNPWVALPRAAVLPLVPDDGPPPGDAPGPFRFADAAALRVLLAEAGFADVACDPVRRDLVLGRAGDGSARGAAEAAAAMVVELGPVSRLLRDRESPLRQAAQAAVADALVPHARDGAVRLEAGCWLVQAA